MKTTTNRLSARLEALAQPRRPRVTSREEPKRTRSTLAPLSERLLQLAKPKVSWNAEIAEIRKESIRRRAAVSLELSEVATSRIISRQLRVSVEEDAATSHTEYSEAISIATETNTLSEEHESDVALPGLILRQLLLRVEEYITRINNGSEPTPVATDIDVKSDEIDHDVAASWDPLRQLRVDVEEDFTARQTNGSEPIPVATEMDTLCEAHGNDEEYGGIDSITSSLAGHWDSEEGNRESDLITTGFPPFSQELVDSEESDIISALPPILSEPADVSNMDEQMEEALDAGRYGPIYRARYLEHLAQKRRQQRASADMPTLMALDASVHVNAGGKRVRELRSLFENNSTSADDV